MARRERARLGLAVGFLAVEPDYAITELPWSSDELTSRLGLDPVHVTAAEPLAVQRSFLDWADERALARGGSW